MRLGAIFFTKNIPKMLDFYSQFNPSPLSIKTFMDFGKFIKDPLLWVYFLNGLLTAVLVRIPINIFNSSSKALTI